MAKNYKLEWYVLNDCGDCRGGCEDKFTEYPYPDGDIKPWNVFNNWHFRDAAIKLSKDYYKGKFNLKTLKEDNMETLYNIKTNTWSEPKVRPEVDALKNDYEAFRYQLLQELKYEEWSRCEYEILVCPLIVHNDKYEEKLDKIDTYTQTLMNSEQFALYVLRTVNGTIKTKKELENNK